MESGAPLTGKVNYLKGKDPSKWQRDISTYGAITYTNLYPGVALDQVQYLIQLMESHPDVSIHILPFDARLPYVPNDFTIMRFTDGTPNCVFVEHVAGGQKIENEAHFKKFVEAIVVTQRVMSGPVRRSRNTSFDL